MKILTQFLKFSAMTVLCGMLLLTCDSDEPEANPEPEPETPGTLDPATVEGLDSLSDHFKFLGFTKKQGKIPAASAGNSELKISFRDTLYLMDGARIPIEFLHDAETNVAGVYVQIHGSSPGTGDPLYSTYHYDIPELAETAGSDTVSVILVSFDPTGFELPLSFPVTITPYDKNGQPIDETEAIFTVEESFDDLSNSGRSKSGSCAFTSPPVEGWWQWAHSTIVVDDEIVFTSNPNIVIGGQNIKGCCVNGVSDYGASCLNGDPKNENTLFFPTYYQIAGETFIFNESGTFERITLEKHGDPDTDNTNFCGVAYGVVTNTNEFVTYEGNWTLDPATKNLRLQTTSSSGFGYGNPGGIIRYNCHGMLMLQLDLEGFGRHLEKFYFRMRPEDYEWYPLP
jgi:hypothetical protein